MRSPVFNSSHLVPIIGAILGLFLEALPAVDTALYLIGKGRAYWQDSEASPLPDEEEPFVFTAEVEGTAANVISAVQLTGPNGTQATLLPIQAGSVDTFEFEADFGALADMDAAVPDDPQNPYVFAITTEHDGFQSASLFLGDPSYPKVPKFQNFNAIQTSDPSTSLLLECVIGVVGLPRWH